MKKALVSVAADYDYILLDCPPSLGLITVNALNAANGLLIPVQVEYYALAGLALIRQTVSMVRELNPGLAILGLVLTFFDSRKTLNKDVAQPSRMNGRSHLLLSHQGQRESCGSAEQRARCLSVQEEQLWREGLRRPC